MHGGSNPNAGAPAFLRPLLDGIDTLSRLDGWLGVLCLVSLTSLIPRIPDSSVMCMADKWIQRMAGALS